MGYNDQTNPDWTQADVDFFNSLKSALLALTYEQKNAFYQWISDRLSSVSGALEYDIVANPDPDNPNEQPEGRTLTDARLGGIAGTVTYGGQSYTKEDFTQTSNSLTMNEDTGILFRAGRTVVVSKKSA